MTIFFVYQVVFQHLMAKVVHEKPDNPVEFIQFELRKLREEHPEISKYRSEFDQQLR